MATTSSTLFDGLDAINYNNGYAHASTSKPGERIDKTEASIRYNNAPVGTKISPNSMVGQHEGGKSLISITNCLNRDQKASIYGSMKSLIRPMYGAADEAYFNYLKGYIGSFLYSPYDWYSTGDDIGFFDYFNLNAGNALYQFIDQAFSDETFWEATQDWWEQHKGVLAATYNSVDIRDELKDTYTSVELYNADGSSVYVISGFDSNGNFVVKFDADKSQAFCDGDMLVQTGAGSVSGTITQYAYFSMPGGFGINITDGGEYGQMHINFNKYEIIRSECIQTVNMTWGPGNGLDEVMTFSPLTGNIYTIGAGSNLFISSTAS